ncbi:hypothetical protein Tco_0439696 [Tanacetum coccineum]
MADKRKKSSMETFAPNDKADYYSGITSITVNLKNAYELKGKFLDDLHNNAFNGTNRKDAVEHIEYYLKIIDPIKLPNVDHDKLRIVVFPISLVGGGDEIEVSNDESSDLEEYWSDKEEIAEIFKIETDVFYYETPLCLAFNEFNYFLKVDLDLLTEDIMGFKTYEDYKDDWIYKWNENAPWVYDKPWLDNGIWKELKPVKHTCKPFNYKAGCLEWSTCSWREDGYCNGGNLLGAYHIENSLRYQDLEWYEALEDSELKDEALWNKAIMEGEYKNETHEEEHELRGIETHQVSVCQIKRYKMIKYSFNNKEEYVVVKEDEYDDLTITSEEACRAYQEIFWMMDEGWKKRWKSHEIYYHNYDDGEYKNETHEEGHELCGIETHQVPICQIKRYKMIKYSFNDEEEYVAVKEDKYDDLTITSEEACRAYLEIFSDDDKKVEWLLRTEWKELTKNLT